MWSEKAAEDTAREKRRKEFAAMILMGVVLEIPVADYAAANVVLVVLVVCNLAVYDFVGLDYLLDADDFVAV